MRRKTSNIDVNEREESRGLVSLTMPIKTSSVPCAAELMIEAVKYGYCQKLNNSLLAYYFSCIFPRWKSRFFILVGNYLFRFSSEHGESPKGVPIPLDSVTIRHSEIENCFEVAMIRKVYTIRAESAESCQSWIKAINDRKGAAIREDLGHAVISTTLRSFNKAGASLFNSTLRKDNAETINPMQSM